MMGVELVVLLAVIITGARLKGMSLGIMGGLGVAIYAFCFHLPPTLPPFDALLVIMAVVTAVGTLEAAGGLAYLVQLAAFCIRKYPHRITFLGPLLTYAIVFLAGTGHIVYSILPIIADVSKKVHIRPERPLSVAVIAALHAVLVSPISALMALVLGILGPYGIELMDVLKVLVPATVGGVMVATCVVSRMGKELHQDPAYLASLATVTTVAEQPAPVASYNTRAAKRSVFLFLLAGVCIIVLGTCKELRPCYALDGEMVVMKMTALTAIIMFAMAGVIVLVGRLNPADIVQKRSFLAGIEALISILGISWLSDTFVQANQPQLLAWISETITMPWQFSFILFSMSAIMLSNSAAIRAIVPLGIAVGIPIPVLIASLPAVSGVFFLPSYPTLLAAVQLDSTGTTRIGKFVLNHSFMLPGLVATATAVGIALGLLACLG